MLFMITDPSYSWLSQSTTPGEKLVETAQPSVTTGAKSWDY